MPNKVTKNAKITKFPNHPCVFSGPFIREQIDPRIHEGWQASFHTPTPFGALRNSWKEVHCATINPYDSTDCPYRPQDCAMSFFVVADRVISEKPASPKGLFRAYARTAGLDRAENKPLARDNIRTDVQERPSNPGDADTSIPARPGMPGTSARPVAIGDLLRALDLGPHQNPTPDGKEGPK